MLFKFKSKKELIRVRQTIFFNLLSFIPVLLRSLYQSY